MELRRTAGGVRLVQHGVVLSEVRSLPGPTHSVFDVLAVLAARLSGGGSLVLLGFAAGGMLAPLRAVGHRGVVSAVDLDPAGFGVFQRHCGRWAGPVEWAQADAVAWLGRRRGLERLIIEDLSVPVGKDVFKPEISWATLPRLIGRRLGPEGVAVFNVLPGLDGDVPEVFGRELERLGGVLTVWMEDFENRVVLAGPGVPGARRVAAGLSAGLRRLGSRQAGRVRVRTGIG